MKTALTVLGAAALFLLAFGLTIAGKSKKVRFITGGVGGLSLLCAMNLASGITGISLGLNAITLPVSFLLGVPGVFTLIGVGIFL